MSIEDYRKMGPLAADHPLVTSRRPCPLCSKPFESGQACTLVPIEELSTGEQNMEAAPVHWTCLEAALA